MKNITLKAISIFIAFWLLWIIAWSVSTFDLMLNTSEQYFRIITPGIIIWIIGAIVGAIIITIFVKPIEKKYKIRKELSNDDLKNISKKALNIHFISIFGFAIIWLTATIVLFLILRSIFGDLAANSIWVGGIAGLIITPFMLFTAIPLLFSKVNRAFQQSLIAEI